MSNKLIKKIKELQKRINSIINELCKEKELIKGSYTYVMKKCSNFASAQKNSNGSALLKRTFHSHRFIN